MAKRISLADFLKFFHFNLLTFQSMQLTVEKDDGERQSLREKR